MKILMLLSRCDQTGVTTHAIDLCAALVARGEDVTVLLGRRKAGNAPEADLRFKQLVATGARIATFHDPARATLVGKLRSVAGAMAYMLTHRFDAIHVQSPYLSFIPWLLRRRFVSTLHVNDLVRCFYYKNATHLIAISRETKAYAKEVFGYKDEDITMVRHGVSTRFAERITPRERLDNLLRLNILAKGDEQKRPIVIGLVGSVERRKGHDLLLEAVGRLPTAQRDRVRLVFLGSSKDGATNDWLNSLIANSGFAGQVSRFEYQPSELFYKLFDIFALPSRLEGFSLAVIEAMLSGCCCIRSDTEGSFDQLDHGQTGFIVKNEDVDDLSQTLLRLMENPQLMRAVAEAGREKALREFTSEVMASNTVEVYKKLRQ